MANEVKEQPQWPAKSVMVCHGAMWQVEGCNVELVQIKEIRQGNGPLNVGMPSTSPNPGAPSSSSNAQTAALSFCDLPLGLACPDSPTDIAATAPVL